MSTVFFIQNSNTDDVIAERVVERVPNLAEIVMFQKENIVEPIKYVVTQIAHLYTEDNLEIIYVNLTLQDDYLTRHSCMCKSESGSTKE